MADNQTIRTIISEWLGIISSILIILTAIIAAIRFIISYKNKKELQINYIYHNYNSFNLENNIKYYIPFTNNPKYVFLDINIEINNPTDEIIFFTDIKIYLEKSKKYPFYLESAFCSTNNSNTKNIQINPNTNKVKFNLSLWSEYIFNYNYLKNNKKLFISFIDNNNKEIFISINTNKKFRFINEREIKKEYLFK